MEDKQSGRKAPTKSRSRWVPVVLWMAIIFGCSSVPKLPIADRFDVNDKALHAIGFGVLAALLWRALPGRRPGWIRAVTVVAWAVLYGYTDEFHQRFVPGRTFDMKDIAADGVGSALAGISAIVWERLRPRPGR